MTHTRTIRTACLALCAVMIGIGFVSSSIILTLANSPLVELPGQDVSETAFVGSINTIPPEQVYPSNYSIISEKPYIINIDYSDSRFISEFTAKQRAWNFIENMFPAEVVDQLEIDERLTELRGALPRWSISFWNATVDVPIHIVATVSVNAISGAIISYIGETLNPSGPVANLSSAEVLTASFIQSANLSILPHSRYTVSNYSNMNREYFRFRFQQALDIVLVQLDIGSFTIELDRLDGGIRSFSYKWISFNEIDTDEIVDPLVQAPTNPASKTLLLYLLHDQDLAVLSRITARLCWRVKSYQLSGPEEFILDAFSGEIVETLDYFGRSSSATIGVAVAPCAISLGFVAYIFGKKKLRALLTDL